MRRRHRQVHCLVVLMLAATRLVAQHAPELRGSVSDATTGAPLGGAELLLSDGARATTTADGTFVLRALRPGAMELAVRLPGYAPHRRHLELQNGESRTLALTLVRDPVRLAELVSAPAAPQATGVTEIDRASIEASGAQDLGDLVQQLGGVVVTRQGGPGSPAIASVRGASAGQLLVVLDGAPVNDALGGGADLSLIRLDNVERVTVLRGAQSARYGPQALAGAIVVETSRPERFEAQASAGAGSWETRSLSGRAGFADRTGRIAAGIGASWNRFGGDFTYDIPPERGGGEAARLNSDAEDLALDGTAGWREGNTEFRVRGEYFDIDRGMPGTVVQPSLTGRQRQRRAGLGAHGGMPAGGAALALDVALQWQRARFTDPAPPFSAAYDDSSRASALVVNATATGALLGVDGSSGVELRRTGIAGSNLATGAPDAITLAGAWVAGRTPLVNHAGSQLWLHAGLRIDGGSQLDGLVASPQLGLSLARDWWTAELRWARAYSPPTLADMYFQEGVQVRPNPDLRPERVRDDWTVALATRSVRLGSWTGGADLALFAADIDDMIIWSPDFRFIWSPANFAVRRRGGELSLQAGPPSGRVRLDGAVALSDIRYTGSVLDGQVIYRPRWSAVAGAEARAAGFVGGASWRYAGPRRTGAGSQLNMLPALHLLDLRLSRGIALGQVGLDARLAVENVFGERTGMLPDFPLPGRIFRFSLSIRTIS